MNEYTTYCTSEQTRKALELGAPIQFASINDIRLGRYIEVESNNEAYVIPTVEQMIGWLNDKGLLVSIVPNCGDYCWQVWERSLIVDMSETETISTIKEATLAAINAALDYLNKNNK